MKLSEFGISKDSSNLSEKIYNVFKEIKEKGIDLLEWDVNDLVFDKDFIREQMYISNTASEKELANSMRNIAIKAEGLENLTIDGMGNRILFNNRAVQIALLNCKNIVFENFMIDYVNPSVAEFKVVGKGFGYVDISINQDTLYTIKCGRLHFCYDDKSRCVIQEFNPITEITRRLDFVSYISHNVFNNKRCKKLNNDIIRVYTWLKCFELGNTYQLNWVRRDGTCFFMDKCKDIVVDNCMFLFMHGMGVLAQLTENVTIKDTSFMPNGVHRRTTASFADIMHFVNCKGVMNVNKVMVDGTRDDVINNHGIHFKIVKVDGNKVQCKFAHPQAYGFNCFFEEDEIEFIDSSSLLPVGSAKVKQSNMISPRITEIELCDIAENSVIKIGDVIENATWTSSLVVDTLETYNVPTRGILVTTRKPVVIKNCVFHKCYMPTIHISDDARSWYESGYCTDVLIENNVFDNCEDYAISIWPENTGNKSVHKNIRILNNKFISDNGKILIAKCADGVIFDNNEIITEQKVDVKLNNLENSKINL